MSSATTNSRPIRRLIHLVDRFDRVNYGIWNAALATADQLQEQYHLQAEMWYPEVGAATDLPLPRSVRGRALADLSMEGLGLAIAEAGLDPVVDVIISHGCWRYPTRWGEALRKKGYRWLAVPHGMLESWSMRQKWLRKKVYYYLRELPALHRADAVRAVGDMEFVNLCKVFGDKTHCIVNGVEPLPASAQERPVDCAAQDGVKRVLFMARLHHKKGILPLVQAWSESRLMGDVKFQLQIAGPDDGELEVLKELLEKLPTPVNIEYLGAVYGPQKQQLLQEATYYALPSFSEGFPTSVLEAMQYGAVPLISDGCNFPDVFKHELGYRLSPEVADIRAVLDQLPDIAAAELARKAVGCRDLIGKNYTNDILARQQMRLLQSL